MHKVMVLGDIAVGKSSLVRRAVHDRFEEDYRVSIACEITRYAVRAGTEPGAIDTDLVLWDTDGNLGLSILRHDYIKGAKGALIVADVTRRATIESSARLTRGFQEAFPGREVVLVFNKVDLRPTSEAFGVPPEFAGFHLHSIETSAKTGHHVHEAFHTIARSILRRGL
jgi:small GTP-binding protein